MEQLDQNTSLEPQIPAQMEDSFLSIEEFAQIEENDPGYINSKVLDYENQSNTEENTYQENGLHTGAIHWGEYADEESIEYVTLEKGKILSRWGGEDGTFLSDTDVEYEKLELPIVEEKNSRNFYEVLKEFPAELSNVKRQPWNDADQMEQNEAAAQAVQYKMPIPVQNLIEEGYLKRVGRKS
ncbi:MAG: TNT domain-containing protein [Lachnospiraceae bacterium]|nr:TNT domain-containing protein [Lachnospiraceae bacterium]